jgi:hypothetical protein
MYPIFITGPVGQGDQIRGSLSITHPIGKNHSLQTFVDAQYMQG